MPAPRLGYSEPPVARRRPATLKGVSRNTPRNTSSARTPKPSARASTAAIDPEIRSARKPHVVSFVSSRDTSHANPAMAPRRSANFSERPGSTAARLAETRLAQTNSPRARSAGERRSDPPRRIHTAVSAMKHTRPTASTRDTRKAPNPSVKRGSKGATRSRAKRQALAIMSPRAGAGWPPNRDTARA
jgi:hypothetical protein